MKHKFLPAFLWSFQKQTFSFYVTVAVNPKAKFLFTKLLPKNNNQNGRINGKNEQTKSKKEEEGS